MNNDTSDDFASANDTTPYFGTALFRHETHVAARCNHRNRRSCDRAHRPAPPLKARGDVAKRRARALQLTAKADRRDWRQLVAGQLDEVIDTMSCVLPTPARFIAATA